MNRDIFIKHGLDFDDLFYQRCEKFKHLLQQWGAVHNLTAMLKDQQIEHNILDSVYPVKFLNDFETLVDIGTGAGYPGILLSIAYPLKKVSVVEPKSKRVAFLSFVKKALDLENLEVIHNRVENMSAKKFDLITSRAVTNTSLLLSLTRNLVKDDTEFLFYKGTLCAQEIEEARLNNYTIVEFVDHRNYLYMKRKGLFDDI
ncbi:MAG: 16S rRNA (guanine(527)-N(7))-methyltransferase RsmG [Campylobacterales bacterium]|nr:16S rRNA (guanine(527)-N(7))-methyltransferase RsmG [Campylobacterales bacterium]